MREIKFRFWSRHLQKFVVPKDDIFVGALKDPDMNPMQYTGLKDKNGTEIYEGDILGHKSRHLTKTGMKALHEIEWNDNTAAFTIPQPLAEFEVIGNIYENPELLDK